MELFEDFVSTESFCFRRHNVLEHFRVRTARVSQARGVGQAFETCIVCLCGLLCARLTTSIEGEGIVEKVACFFNSKYL